MTTPIRHTPPSVPARTARALLALACAMAVLPGVCQAAATPRQSDVIVQLTSGTPLATGRALVRDAGGRPGTSLKIIDGLSARVDAAGIKQLAADPRVHAVTPNSALHSQTLGGPLPPDPWRLATSVDRSIDAPRLWWHSTGAGVGVAVIDTGVEGDLPDFRDAAGNSRVVASAVINPGATTAGDSYGHGTAVGGLIAGNGDRRDLTDSEWGRYAGSAPNANLISIKIADDAGNSTILDAIYGLQFAVDHQQQYNIRVVNLSLRSTTAESASIDPLDAAVEQAWLHGIVVVAAAGNLGTESDAVSYAPANDPYALTVGAVDTAGTASDSDDTIPSWSSQGVTQDGVTKPDVLAPGAHIVTTLSPGSDFASECPTCVVDGGYFQLSGTSLAAPLVSGIAADLIADHPDWSPDQVKGAIDETAAPLPGGGAEVDGGAADADWNPTPADQGLTPNTLIDPASGDIDYSAASWSAASWSAAADPQAASWSAASWSCESCTSDPGDASVDPTAASWSSVGWTSIFK